MVELPDPALRARFRRDGYVVVPLLEASAVAALKDYWEVSDQDVSAWPYAASLYSSEVDFRREASAVAKSVLTPALARIAPGAQIIFAGFACKAPNEPASLVPFHQDPSFVDEQCWGAANIWVPLVDLHDDNGPLWVVPGSHRFNHGWRAFNQPFAYSGLESHLKNLARPLAARAGEAILFAHTLFHFSPPNLSSQPRPAVGGMLAQPGAPLFYLYMDPDEPDWIEVYEADPDLYLDRPISSRPERRMSGRMVAARQALLWDGRRLKAPALRLQDIGQDQSPADVRRGMASDHPPPTVRPTLGTRRQAPPRG